MGRSGEGEGGERRPQVGFVHGFIRRCSPKTHKSPLCRWISAHGIQARRVRCKVTRPRERGGSFACAPVVRDGLLECPNCAGDHFTTLGAPQKNLFNGTLAQPARTGLVLTDLPPFIVTAPPTNSLLLPRRCSPRGRADEMGSIRKWALKITAVKNEAASENTAAHARYLIWTAEKNVNSSRFNLKIPKRFFFSRTRLLSECPRKPMVCN